MVNTGEHFPLQSDEFSLDFKIKESENANERKPSFFQTDIYTCLESWPQIQCPRNLKKRSLKDKEVITATGATYKALFHHEFTVILPLVNIMSKCMYTIVFWIRSFVPMYWTNKCISHCGMCDYWKILSFYLTVLGNS